MPLWKPPFLHHISEIKDPKGLLGTVGKAVTLLRKDRYSLFTSDQLSELDSLQYGNDLIADLDFQVCREGWSLDEVTADQLASRR